MLIIGLTGGIGSGKSAVSARFEALGVPCIDADRLTRELVAPGTPLLAAIAEAFGPGILCDDGSLDRASLRARIFARDDERHRLEALMHPAVRAETDRRLALLASRDTPYCLLVIPLLVETGGTDRVHRVLVVDVDESTQIRRTVTRDEVDEGHVRAILQSQASRAERLQAADDVLVNDGTPDELGDQVRALHERYSRLAGSRKWGDPRSRARDAES